MNETMLHDFLSDVNLCLAAMQEGEAVGLPAIYSYLVSSMRHGDRLTLTVEMVRLLFDGKLVGFADYHELAKVFAEAMIMDRCDFGKYAKTLAFAFQVSRDRNFSVN